MNNDRAQKTPIAGMTISEITDSLINHGIDGRYAARVAYWVYKKRVHEIIKMNSIAGSVRQKIESQFTPGLKIPSTRLESADGSVKYLFEYSYGRKIETVFIPEVKRNTVCVSTQCGCARGCVYCKTGEMGFSGNLTAGEIVNQVMAIPEATSITNVVFMGMGEPLDNVSEVIKATYILTAQWGLSLGSASITVSTVGIIPRLERLLSQTRCNVTLSLVSAISEERARLVPTEKKYPVNKLIEMMKNAPPEKRRRFTIAYMMLNEINDSDRHLDALIGLAKGSSLRINLLRYHRHGDNDLLSSTDARMEYFLKRLMQAGISASIRKSRGEDISAACGLLAGNGAA